MCIVTFLMFSMENELCTSFPFQSTSRGGDSITLFSVLTLNTDIRARPRVFTLVHCSPLSRG